MTTQQQIGFQLARQADIATLAHPVRDMLTLEQYALWFYF